MKVLTYNDINIDVLLQNNQASKAMKLACDVTQKKVSEVGKPMSAKLANYLMDAEHTSIFEHGSMTILASGISRSLLAQVTRQRMFSFTSASQHYQDYRDYPMSLRPQFFDNEEVKKAYIYALDSALQSYITLIELGEKPEEARQVLPNACTVNLVITANPRALVDFLKVRLCERNTLEMLIFANKLLQVCNSWLPEIFGNVGPACLMNKCNQGSMTCRKS